MTAASDAARGSNALDGMPDLLVRAFTGSDSGILIIKADAPAYTIVFVNPAFCRMADCSFDEVVGESCSSLRLAGREQPALASVCSAIAGGEHTDAVLSSRRKDGSLFLARLEVCPVALDTGEVTHHVGILHDAATSGKQDNLRASRTVHDPVTNLPDRRYVEDLLAETIRGTDREQESVGLLVLNIDNFKLVNDLVGYRGGDHLLSEAAGRMFDAVPRPELLSRHGIDEFAVVVPGLRESSEATALAEKLLEAISGVYTIIGENVRVTCSIGIALYPKDGDNAAALLRYADMALHRAKELGGGNIQYFSKELGDRIAARLTLEAALRDAIDREEFVLHYQPQVDLQSGRVAGFEALLRWTSPVLGAVEPVRFIAIAEECGLIEPIGEWVLRRACRDMKRWAEAGLPDIRVAVNVSPRQFRDPCLAEKIGGIVSESGIDAKRLSLEITESILMQDTPLSKTTLARIQAMGIELALDDFGTGYSSLGYLKRYPFSKVKIDRSFVEHVVSDPEDSAIAKAAISMAHSLGIRVVAEGVETELQCDFLRRNMCDEIQGFLFSPAMPAADVEKLLREGRSLPAHLLRFSKPRRTLLLVDDEANVLAALKRLLRRDDYTVLTASSGPEGLAILEKQAVDVIVSDQRMPGMTGVEFLGKVKDTWPDTVRIVLSGYTELQSVTEAINKGSIYKFLMKPWDDAQLREQIAQAFRHKEMADENRRLTLEVQTANFELAASNRRLAEVLEQQRQQLLLKQVSLDVVRELLLHMPTPVIGLDEDDVVAFANAAAQRLFADDGLLLGSDARLVIPDLLDFVDRLADGEACDMRLKDSAWRTSWHRMGHGSQSRGRMITLLQEKMYEQ